MVLFSYQFSVVIYMLKHGNLIIVYFSSVNNVMCVFSPSSWDGFVGRPRPAKFVVVFFFLIQPYRQFVMFVFGISAIMVCIKEL